MNPDETGAESRGRHGLLNMMKGEQQLHDLGRCDEKEQRQGITPGLQDRRYLGQTKEGFCRVKTCGIMEGDRNSRSKLQTGCSPRYNFIETEREVSFWPRDRLRRYLGWLLPAGVSSFTGLNWRLKYQQLSWKTSSSDQNSDHSLIRLDPEADRKDAGTTNRK